MSIADELQLLINTKESLRVAIGLSTSIPFSQYKNYIYDIPSAGESYDFVKNRFFSEGETKSFSDMPSQFIRLSSATMWQDGELVEVANNVPRISSEGLLIEPQRTNSVYYSSDIREWGSDGIASVDYSSSVGINGESLITATNREFGAGVYTNSYRVAGEAYSLSFQAKPSNWSKIKILSGSTPNGNDLNNALEKPIIDLETGTSYDADTSVSALLDGWSSVSRRRLSTASGSQYNTGISLLFADKESKAVPDGSSVYMRNAQAEKLPSDDSLGTSYIPTDGAPETRAPEIMNIPLLPTQTITGDWDAGVTYSLAGGIATFTGHGYIRNIAVEAL